ncbi:hypothetical protein Nmel_001535, partial [Mimus melanotis]
FLHSLPSPSPSLSPSLLSSHPAPPLGSPRPPPSGAPIGRALPTWGSRRARDAGERCRCQRQSARGGVGIALLLSIPSAVPILKETSADARRVTGNNGLPGCHGRTGLGRGIGREHCACARGGCRGSRASSWAAATGTFWKWRRRRPRLVTGRGGGRELFRSLPRDGS